MRLDRQFVQNLPDPDKSLETPLCILLLTLTLLTTKSKLIMALPGLRRAKWSAWTNSQVHSVQYLGQVIRSKCGCQNCMLAEVPLVWLKSAETS